MSILRKSAMLAPHCFSCGWENVDGQLLCLAHSNELIAGRGAYHKTPDILGAIVCLECHQKIDGQAGKLSRQDKHRMHRDAHFRTLCWWIKEGLV